MLLVPDILILLGHILSKESQNVAELSWLKQSKGTSRRLLNPTKMV